MRSISLSLPLLMLVSACGNLSTDTTASPPEVASQTTEALGFGPSLRGVTRANAKVPGRVAPNVLARELAATIAAQGAVALENPALTTESLAVPGIFQATLDVPSKVEDL